MRVNGKVMYNYNARTQRIGRGIDGRRRTGFCAVPLEVHQFLQLAFSELNDLFTPFSPSPLYCAAHSGIPCPLSLPGVPSLRCKPEHSDAQVACLQMLQIHSLIGCVRAV